jgi:hypothetical protein
LVVKIESVSVGGDVSDMDYLIKRVEGGIGERTGSSDGEGTLDSAEFLVGDERGVGGETNVDLVGLQEAGDVLRRAHVNKPLSSPLISIIRGIAETYLSTEAVPNSTNALHTQSLTDILNRSLNNGINIRGLVLRQPGGQISLARFHIRDADLVTREQVRDDGQVSTLGELIGEELGVGEDAEDVGQEDDGLFGGLVVLGVSDVGVD